MRIVIADDHPLYREALHAQLERLFVDALILEFDSFDGVMQLAREPSDDTSLFLLDYDMPGMSADSLRRLVEMNRSAVIAVISGTATSPDVRTVIRSGARGFIPKTATPSQFSHAIQLLLSGGTSVPAAIALSWESEPAAEAEDAPAWVAKLTSRERDVLRGVMRGLPNKQIGRELDLAEVTIKLHLRTIFRKIGAATRSEAAVMATKARLE